MRIRPPLSASLIVLCAGASSFAQGPIRLREVISGATTYHVSTHVDLTGELTVPPEEGQKAPSKVSLTGRSFIEYEERILDMGTADRPGPRTLRIYRRVDLERTVGDKPQDSTIRPTVRRMVILRTGHREVPFSPDGPLTWSEIDLVRTDVFTPALTGLLPERPVVPGDRWSAAAAAVEELTDLEKIEEGALECRFDEITSLAGRRLARVRVAGTVRGVNEDGPNRQQFDGYFYFDLASNHLSYLFLEATHLLLDKDGQTAGRVKGRFVLTREVKAPSRELRDEAVRGLSLEPTAENTLLLYDNPELGVRFLYPRRWRVGVVRGRQVILDEANGNGLLLTVESAGNVPTAAAYLAECQTYLTKEQKARILRTDAPKPLSAQLEHLGLDVELNGRRERMEYYIVRQTGGGAVLAARFQSKDSPSLERDVERIARSVQVTAPASPLRPVK
jgi:hypothetical protein